MVGGHVRIAVIGAGRMGAIRATDLVADPRVDEVLIANRKQGRAEELAAAVGAVPIPWAQVATPAAITALGADGIVVALATDAHAGVLEATLRTGRPTLCEKPIALTLEDTSKVVALADSHGTTLQIGFQRRFDPGIRAMHDRIASGGLGALYSMSLLSHDIAPSGPEFIAGSGGIFRDLHVHDFDVIRWLTGSEIDTVYATRAVRAHHAYAEFDDADTAVIHAVTASGVQVVVRGARHNALGHDVRVEAQGSSDSVVAGLTSRTPLHVMDGALGIDTDPYAGFVDRFREAFRLETAAFVSVVEGSSPNPCGPDAALESLRVAIACERSVASREPVRVGDVRPAVD
jgi:myo-inositol 2-dehydrogenase/D-chiro-inositol 1-dehydrogenase